MIYKRTNTLLAAGLLALGLLLARPAAQGAEFYVSGLGGRDVWRFNDSGVATRYLTDLAGPVGLALDQQNNLYISCMLDNTILKVTPAGERSLFATGLNVPYGMAFNAQGDLFVAENGSSSIARVRPDGTVSTFATLDTNPGNVAFDANGNLYTQGSSSTLLRISPDGTRDTFASGLVYPCGLAFDSAGNLFVSNGNNNNTISKITPNGQVSEFVGSTSGWRPYGLSFGSDGDLYVADLRNQIARVSLDGGITTVLPEPTGLNTPLFLVAVVPEPGCWQLATTAAAVLTCMRVLSRRKRGESRTGVSQ